MHSPLSSGPRALLPTPLEWSTKCRRGLYTQKPSWLVGLQSAPTFLTRLGLSFSLPSLRHRRVHAREENTWNATKQVASQARCTCLSLPLLTSPLSVCHACKRKNLLCLFFFLSFLLSCFPYLPCLDLRVIRPLDHTKWFDIYPNVESIKKTTAPVTS